MGLCYLYPGQGAQYVGMGLDLLDAGPEVRRLFEMAADTTGVDCLGLLKDSTEEQLKATDVSQIAIALVNKAASVALKANGLECAGCAGFSLGEYSALNDAGVIRDQDLFPIVKLRGEIMERVSRTLDTPGGQAGMAAVVGLEMGEVVRILERMRGEDPPLYAYAALHNAQTQTVISGTAEALGRAETLLTEAGAMKYVVLRTSGPFHSPLMEAARRDLRQALEPYAFGDPAKTVYSNVTGGRIARGQEAKSLCADQLVSTVRWVDVQTAVRDDGYERLLEVGPGSVLAGLWKRFQRGSRCLNAGKLEEIRAIKEGQASAG